MGIEYEGGKPGWNDAMNGLPGLIGSGMPETYEMLRILKWVKYGVDTYQRDIEFPKEFGDFLNTQMDIVSKYFKTEGTINDKFIFWDKSNTAREMYRTSINGYLTGNKTIINAKQMSNMLNVMIKKVNEGKYIYIYNKNTILMYILLVKINRNNYEMVM